MKENLYFTLSLIGHMISVSILTTSVVWCFFFIKDSIKKTLNYKIFIEKKDSKINWIKDGF